MKTGFVFLGAIPTALSSFACATQSAEMDYGKQSVSPVPACITESVEFLRDGYESFLERNAVDQAEALKSGIFPAHNYPPCLLDPNTQNLRATVTPAPGQSSAPGSGPGCKDRMWAFSPNITTALPSESGVQRPSFILGFKIRCNTSNLPSFQQPTFSDLGALLWPSAEAPIPARTGDALETFMTTHATNYGAGTAAEVAANYSYVALESALHSALSQSAYRTRYDTAVSGQPATQSMAQATSPVAQPAAQTMAAATGPRQVTYAF